MRYGDKRWIDIDSMDKDRVVVVCPIGSLEQHGHHLPLLTDTYLVTEVAERVEKKLSNKVLLTPTLWLGASDHHLDFAGTVSVPNSLYVEMLKNIVRSFVKHGFGRIMFLNGHGGNIAPGEVAITEMAHSNNDCDDTMVVFANYWALAGDGFAPEKHGMQTPEVTHACEYETSMMQVVRNDLVHVEDALFRPDRPLKGLTSGGTLAATRRSIIRPYCLIQQRPTTHKSSSGRNDSLSPATQRRRFP